MTEELYPDRGPVRGRLVKFTDANGGTINMLLTEKNHQVAIGSSSKRGDPRGPSHPPRYPPLPRIPAWRILTKRRGVSDTLKAGSHAHKLRSLSAAPETSPGDFPAFGMDDCTPATAIGQPEVAPVANFLRRQRSAPVPDVDNSRHYHRRRNSGVTVPCRDFHTAMRVQPRW